MNKRDEELQKNIEAGMNPAGNDPDVQAYHEVFARLSHEPELHLSPAFSDRIILKILERKKQNSFTDFLWMGTGFLLLTVSCIVAVVMSGVTMDLDYLFTMNLGILKNISVYTGLFAFSAAFIIMLNLFEKKFIFQKKDSLH